MTITLNKKRVGVLRGGPSSLYEVSLNTGKFVIQNLKDSEEYEPVDIFISKKGVWHEYGYEKKPERIIKKLDGVFNAMHGNFGEDGRVQQILESFGIPYTGSDVFACSASINKVLAKNLFKKFGIKTPSFVVVKKEEPIFSAIDKIFYELPFPIIIKPANSGSSLGVSVVFKKSDLPEALHNAFLYSDESLAEEFISGKEVTCGAINDFRDHHTYSLLPIEIRLPKNRIFYDYRAKFEYRDKDYLPLGNLSREEIEKIKEISTFIHTSMGLRHYSQSDFIVHPRRGVYLLEVNTLPPLGEKTSFIKSLEFVGSNIKEFLHHILHKTFGRK